MAALALKSDEPWMVLDAGLIELGAGQVEPAKARIKQGIELVAARLEAAAKAKQDPPSDLLEALSTASADFDELSQKKGFAQAKVAEELGIPLKIGVVLVLATSWPTLP